jgi:GR25 family glycosyltransferase involved in LPS biosynthesis
LKSISDNIHKEYLIFDRVNAINGKTLKLTPELLNLFNDNDFGYRRGVIGCALSHYYLWKELINSNNNYYIIMEDDAILVKGFKKKIEQLLMNINDYELLFCGYHVRESDKEKLDNINTFDSDNDNDISIKLLNTNIYIGGTHCYIITKKAAIKLVDYIDLHGIKHGIDYLMAKVQKEVDVFEAVPHICYADWVEKTESNIDSNIQRDHTFASINVSDKYIFLEKLDQIDNDCYIAEKHLSKYDYETMADSIEDCIAFNTLGYFKNKITNLVISPYFSNCDGIYINKDYYFNVFKKKE